MSQIEELHGRITAAMERISVALAALSEKDGGSSELAAALEEEKLANAQLEERLHKLKESQAEEIEVLRAELDNSEELAAARAELASQAEAMARLDMDVQRLRQANDQLRESNAALRAANEKGVGEPHLINKAMLAELEALRAVRATDAAEAGAVLARLQPLLDQALPAEETS